MAMVTKKMLEEQNKDLWNRVAIQMRNNEMLKEQLAFFKQYSPPGVASCMMVALEKVTDAVAHVLTDLKRPERPR